MRILVHLSHCGSQTKSKDLRRMSPFSKRYPSAPVMIDGQKLTRGDEIMFIESREIFIVKSVSKGYVELGLRDNEGNEINTDSVMFSDGIIIQIFEDRRAQIVDTSLAEWAVIHEGEFHE